VIVLDASAAVEWLLRLPLAGAVDERLSQTDQSLRPNLTASDASYVALAVTLEATLLTLDARLAAAPLIDAHVELIA